MPTKYQAQVKIASDPHASRVSVDAVGRAANLSGDGIAKKSSAIPRRSEAQHYTSNSAVDVSQVELEEIHAPTGVNAFRNIIYATTKRVMDLILGSILLVFAIPLVLLAAIAIRIDTPGSPFFFQTRIGRNGKTFKIFKLRGMYVDARVRFPKFYDYSAKRDLEFCFHHEHDPRVTSAGKFIRKTSIDELPNLWNVVLGDMSLVGPRPEIPEVMALYGNYRDQYLSVKPGLTCTSKCTGRDRLTKKETIEFDLDYIRKRSLAVDVRILWRTFRSVVTRRDVF